MSVSLGPLGWNWPVNKAGYALGWDADGRALTNVARESFNLKDFGAVGDGVTDDTDAVQDALEWVAAGGEGGREIRTTAGDEYLLLGKVSVSVPNHATAVLSGSGGQAGVFLVANTDGGIEFLCEGSAPFVVISDIAIVPAIANAGTLLAVKGQWTGTGGGVDHNTLIVRNLNGTPLQRASSTYYSLNPFVFTRLKRPYLENIRYIPGKLAFTSGGVAVARSWGKALIDVSNSYGPTIIGGKIGGSADYGILMDYTGTVSDVESGVEKATEGGYVNDIRVTNTKYGLGFFTDPEQPGLKIEGNHFNPSTAGLVLDGAKRFRIDNNLIYSNNGTVYTWTRSGNTLTVTADEPHRIPNIASMQVRVNFTPEDIEDPDYDGDGDGTGDAPPSGTYDVTYISTTQFSITDAGFAALAASGVMQVRWATADFADFEVRNGRHGRFSKNMFGQQASRRRRHWKFDMTDSVKASPVIFDMEVEGEALTARTVVEPLYVGDDVDLLTARIPYTTGDGYDSVSYPDNPASVSAAATRVIVNDRMDGFDERSEGGLINLVPNGKFARGSKGWDASAGWTISVDATDALTLNSKARYVGPDTSNGNLYMKTPSPCEEGAPVLVEWYYKVASGTVSNHRARANFYDVDGLDVGSTSFGDSVTSTPSDWTRRSYAFTVPSGAVTFVAGVQIATSTGGTVDIDRISAMQPISVAMAEGARGELVVSDGGATIMPSFEYEDTAALAAATVPAIVTRVYCRYYTAANKIGGAWYKRVNAEPSHNLKVEDASGAWFEHDETDIWVEQAGAIGDGTTNDATAIQSCIALAAARDGGKVRLRAVDYAITATLTVTANNVFIEGMGQSDYHSAQADWSTNAATRIKWTGASGGTIVSFESPVANDKKIGGGMSRIMLDGNDFLANRGLEVKTWNRAEFYAVTVHACAVECFWTGISSNAIVNDKGVQCVTFRECVASARGTSGTYLTSTSVGFRLTGKNSDNANTNFCLLTHCRAVMSKGVPYQLENCDNNTLIQCSGGAQRDATVPSLVFGSAEYDSIESVGGARYNSAIFCQLQTLCASGQSGGNSSAANMVLLSNANGVTVPTFQTPAGGSDQSTCTVLDCDGTLTLGSTQVLGVQKTGWDIPVGAQNRTWINPASLTVTELAKRFYALVADLQEHGVIDASTGAAIPDSLSLAAGYENVVAISFIDNTMTIRDTVTPANDYQGTATGKLTVTGTLTSGANGATFDATNYATLATTLFNWSNATGTVMVEYDDPAFTTGANATIFQIDDGTANERHIFRSITTTADKPRAVMYDGGVLQLDSSPAGWPTYVNGTVARVVLAFELNNTRISHSGTGATDTGCTMPTVTTLRLGVGIAGAEPLNGRIHRVLIIPTRLANDDADALSVV